MGLERGGGRVRITNLNTASHLCVASSEMEGKGVRGVKGKAVYLGGGGGGGPVWAEAQELYSVGVVCSSSNTTTKLDS